MLDPKAYLFLEDYGVPGNYVRHKLLFVLMEKG